MVSTQIPFIEAQKITRKNSFRVFGNSKNDGASGYERLVDDSFPNIHVSPKFKLDKSKAVYTIGSCFARNVEFFLRKSGVDCISSNFLVPGEFYEMSGHGARNGALNAYTAHSMRDVIRLTERADRETAGLLQVGDDEYCDMMVSGLKPLNAEQSSIARNTVIDAYEAMANASTVIITLGYTESWFDTLDNIYVNRSPGGSLKTARKGKQYNFHNVSAAEVTVVLGEIIDLIGQRTKNRAKIIFTVSPVPLHGTFTNRDVILANLYSKSTLLCAAVESASKYDNVDYFPSYEMVTNSDRNTSWEADGVHVKREVIEKVMDRFGERYFA